MSSAAFKVQQGNAIVLLIHDMAKWCTCVTGLTFLAKKKKKRQKRRKKRRRKKREKALFFFLPLSADEVSCANYCLLAIERPSGPCSSCLQALHSTVRSEQGEGCTGEDRGKGPLSATVTTTTITSGAACGSTADS